MLPGFRDLMRMTGRWNGYTVEREASRQQICEYVMAHKNCFQVMLHPLGAFIDQGGDWK